MFDIGWTEMAIVVVIALLVVGPKDLPKVLRTVRQWVGKARSMAREFQNGVDDLVREAELKDLKAEVEDATKDQLAGEFDDLMDPTDSLPDEPAIDDLPPTPETEPSIKPTGSGGTHRPASKSGAPQSAEATPDVAEPPAADSAEADEDGQQPADAATASNR